MIKLDPSRISILAVDDSAEDCQLNCLILEAVGYDVTTAATLHEARALLAERSYNVLLVDLSLPDGHGLSLLAPAQTRDPHTVAVILTGFTSADNAVAALKAGAYDFLTKPSSPEKLTAAVNRAAEKHALSLALGERTRELEQMNRTLDNRVRDATLEIFELNEKLKRYVADLVKSNNSQTQALEEMAHELKNPLSVIWGYSSFLLRSPMENWSADDLKRSVESIHRNARHLQTLIDELLDSARLAGRKIVLEHETFPAEEAVREAVEGLRIQAEKKNITLSAETIDSDCLVHADRNRVRQILVNLVTNAVKFTPAEGSITVSAQTDPDGILLRVSDTGPGIPSADAKKIFDRFYQVRPNGKRENKGLGLGLNIVQGLVKLHHGRIWVESEPGKGAHFNVFLPGAHVDKTSPSPAPAGNPAVSTNPN